MPKAAKSTSGLAYSNYVFSSVFRFEKLAAL